MSRKSSTAASPAPTAAPASRAANKQPAMPIVSSAHLVSPESAEMSEFEFGLIVAGNAFHRWVVHCMSAAGLKDLTPLDVLVLHHVSHRARCRFTLKEYQREHSKHSFCQRPHQSHGGQIQPSPDAKPEVAILD